MNFPMRPRRDDLDEDEDDDEGDGLDGGFGDAVE